MIWGAIALTTNSTENLPDIFYDEDYNFAEYITYYEDLFYDLTSKIDINEYPSYKNINVTLDEKVYAIPYDSGTGVLYYRSDLIQKAEKDKVSIEHILPQTPTKHYWRNQFRQFSEAEIEQLSGALGNLLPLSQSVNSSLQNDSFYDKKSSNSSGRRGYDSKHPRLCFLVEHPMTTKTIWKR